MLTYLFLVVKLLTALYTAHAYCSRMRMAVTAKNVIAMKEWVCRHMDMIAYMHMLKTQYYSN